MDCCLCCGSHIEEKGFEGDWKVLDCPDCSVTIYRPASVVTEDGITMEELGKLSKFS